jgi:hypothetical protein
MVLDLLLRVGAAAPMPRYLWHDIMQAVELAPGRDPINMYFAALALWGVFQGWDLPRKAYTHMFTLITTFDSVVLQTLLESMCVAIEADDPLEKAALCAPATGHYATAWDTPAHGPAADPLNAATLTGIRRCTMWELLARSNLKHTVCTLALLQDVDIQHWELKPKFDAWKSNIQAALRGIQVNLHEHVYPTPFPEVLCRAGEPVALPSPAPAPVFTGAGAGASAGAGAGAGTM